MADNKIPLKADGKPIDEFDVRAWFLHADFDEAYATSHIVGGIIEGRKASQPKRKRRKKEPDVQAQNSLLGRS